MTSLVGKLPFAAMRSCCACQGYLWGPLVWNWNWKRSKKMDTWALLVNNVLSCKDLWLHSWYQRERIWQVNQFYVSLASVLLTLSLPQTLKQCLSLMLAVTQVVNLTAINTVNFYFEDIGQEILEAFPGDWMALVLEQIFLIISCLNFRTWQSEALVCSLFDVCVWFMHACMLQPHLTLCNPVDCSPPGSSVHGILQSRILDWVAMPSSKGSSQPRDWNCISWNSCIAGGFFTTEPLGKPGIHAGPPKT